LVLIEDVAQAHGAEYKNQKTGTFGEAGCFSFYPTKNLGAYGDGGLITVGRDHLAEKIISLRTQGIASEDKYFHQELGTNSRLDELQAAILNVKMNYIEQWIEKRRKIARFYDEALKSEADWLETPVVAPDRTHVYHQYCIRTSRRDDLQKSLNEKGIAASPYYPYSMHLMPPLKKYGFKEGDFPEAERAAKEVLSLPCFPQMTQDELNYVIESVKSFRKSLK